jgi:prepilin-type N-terminal cleavage/methylation domain-containing protein
VKKSTKKGFTLVELLVTIVLLGIIGTIVVYNMMNVSTSSKESEYDRFIAKVKSAAETYASVNPDVFKDLYINKAYLYIKMEDLINDGKIDENLVNPYTNVKIQPDELIKANLSTVNGALTFEYPVEGSEEESFLVALSDYVVYGEPYDCMQGAGTYQLALSDEEGNLIMLDDEETVEKYNFSCSYPSSFKTYDSSYPESYQVGEYTNDPGTYDITYTWITESGIRKSTTRTLRVLSKVKPTFTMHEVVGTGENQTSTLYNYNFESSPYYTPTYTTENGWKYLTYTPYVEGADPETTVYNVTKIALNQYDENNSIKSGAVEETVVENSTDYTTAYPVDDGPKKYTIETTVHGHYNKEYYYEASNELVIKSKLVIPQEYVTLDGSDWSTDKVMTVLKGIHSPVGIAYYEYKFADSTPSASAAVESTYTFNNLKSESASVTTILNSKNRVSEDSPKNVSVIRNSGCVDKQIEYTTIYIRAINDNGYVGDWTSVTIKLTNDLKKLLIQDTNCIKTSSSECYYTTKSAYLEYGGYKFVVLRNYGTGKYYVTLATNGTSVSPNTISSHDNTIRIASCDMMVSANFRNRYPILERIYAGDVLNITNISKHAVYYRWSSTAMTMYSYNGHSDKFDSTTTQYSVKSYTSYYSSFYGNATTSDINTYGAAMVTGSPYWTTDMFSQQVGITAVGADGTHQTSTSYYNTYLYYGSATGGTCGSNSNCITYVGQTMPVKPMLYLKDINVCEVTTNDDGSITYKVATN